MQYAWTTVLSTTLAKFFYAKKKEKKFRQIIARIVCTNYNYFFPFQFQVFLSLKEILHMTIIFVFLLDRHLGWRSLDPTLDISSNFMKEAIYLLFCILLKKMHFFHLFIQSFAPWPGLVRLGPDSLNGSVHYFLLFFPFWLTTTLSHLMAVYSANEIRTFFVLTI